MSQLRFFLVSIVIFGCMGFVRPVGAETDLNHLIELALEKNPEIRAAQARLEAAQARVPQTGAWDDPRVGVNFANIPIRDPSLSRTPMTGIEYGLKQRLPFPGKKGRAKKAARFSKDAVSHEAEDTITRVIWQIRDRYYELYDVTQSINILKRNQVITDELVNLAQRRLATNLAPEQDVLKAQIEYGNITNQLLELDRRKKSLRAQINALVGRDSTQAIHVSKSLSLKIKKANREEILDQARRMQPQLEARAKKINAAQAQLGAARLEYYPDIDIGFTYRQRQASPGDPVNGEDFFSAGVTIPLPIFAAAKQSKRVKESAALLVESRANHETLERQLEFQAEDIVAAMERAAQEIHLTTNALLPQARAAFDNSKAAYETGMIDFLNVLTNQLSALHFEMNLVRAQTDYAQAVARLDYLTGKRPEEIKGGSND